LQTEHEIRMESALKELDLISYNLQHRFVGTAPHNTATRNGTFTATELKGIQIRLASAKDAKNHAEIHRLADKIIASLNYDSRPVRHDAVPQAHKNTFQWAFDSRLAEWFRTGSGIFWISGKPGSGKSTLMKFVASHTQTKDMLTTWAGCPGSVAIAAHFFWIAGTAIQKSWQGLLQSLLFDVFHKHPSIMSLVIPRRWQAAKSGNWAVATDPWSLSELSSALRTLSSTPDLPIKICFFIDGLDEYDNNHVELCAVLRDMVVSPHIKMCLSSRPWPVFEKYFGTDPKLRLDVHELTQKDIQDFAQDQLQSHLKWSSANHQGQMEQKLMVLEQISAKADGVFLWAFFVTRTLRETLSAGGSIADLQSTLNALPQDLEELFKHMLDTIDEQSRPTMAAVLQAARHELEPLRIEIYWHIEKEVEEPGHARHCHIGHDAPEAAAAKRAHAALNVNVKTKGLLKVVHNRAEFLHRTVKDFLNTPDMEAYLRNKLPPDHNSYLAIATAYLGFLKTTRLDHYLVAGIVRQGPGLTSGQFVSHLNHALLYVAEALKSNKSQPIQEATFSLLNGFERATEEMIRVKHVSVTGISHHCDPRVPFREEVLRHDLAEYLSYKLDQDSRFLDILDQPPLFAAITPMALSTGESRSPPRSVLTLLLQRGYNPNQSPIPTAGAVYDPASPWVVFSRSTMAVFNMLTIALIFPSLRWNEALDNGLFDLLLAYGANPNQPLLVKPGAHTVFSHFLEISLSKFLGHECFEGYIRTLRAFMTAGASLEAPTFKSGEEAEELAFGNLARKKPTESLVTSYCAEFKDKASSLAADPERATFIGSVFQSLLLRCVGDEEALTEASDAVRGGLPASIAAPLLSLAGRPPKHVVPETLKRQHRESWGEGAGGSARRQFKG